MTDDHGGSGPAAVSSPVHATEAGPAKAGTGDTGKRTTDNQHDEDAAAFIEAYQNGRRLTTDGPMAFLREAEITELHVGDKYQFGGHHRGSSSGSVRKRDLELVRARYLPVTGYERMHAMLIERRLVVLRGSPGTGRTTTAIRLLDEFAGGKVYRMECEKGIKSLGPEDFERGRGYLIELLGDPDKPLTETRLDTLCDLLRTQSCYCVLISDEQQGSGLPAGYTVDCPSPDPDALLRSHIAEEVDPDDDDGVEDLLSELAASPRLRAALGPDPRPSETVRMAELLAQFGRKAIDLDEVETEAAKMVRQQVIEWFMALSRPMSKAARDEAMRLAAFRIALAVFNESPYHLVAEAGNKLTGEFAKITSDKEKVTRTLFDDDQARRLPQARAHIVDWHLIVGSVRIPTGVALFKDDRFPVVLLSYVWQNHHNLRDAMVRWLREMSRDPRPLIWVRAAQATGLFCALDYHFTFHKMILPGAKADGKAWEQRRRFAAVALDQAARDTLVRAAIHERLRIWRRYGTRAERWTTAAALSYDLGRADINRAIDELRILGTPSEQKPGLNNDNDDDLELVHRCGKSLANLLAFGEVWPVLTQLASWTASDRRSLRELAWWTIRHLINIYGYDLDLLSESAGREKRILPGNRERWPLLLVLQDENSHLTQPIAGLINWILRARMGDQIARLLFSRWVRAGEEDQECLDALVRFVPHLVDRDSDANRLSHLINQLRQDWSDPLTDEMADLLDLAIRRHTVQEVAS